MSLSFVQYTANGATYNFSVPFPYISQDDVAVTVDNVTAPFTWSSSSVVHVTTLPANAAVVEVRRRTQRDSAIVDYSDASTLTETNLDQSNQQFLYLVQEAADDAENSIQLATDATWDADSRRIKNVATPVSGNDAVNKTYADANAVLTAADVVLSHADVVLTHADVVLTHADAATTATAATSATASATTATTQASAASTSATAAASSATAAASSASGASTSATAAATSATASSTSATASAASATTATTQAGNASTSASGAAASATTATTQAGAASTSASGAATSATTATTQAGNASTSATAAAASATAAATSAAAAAGGSLQIASNLSDVASASTARTNLGLTIGTNVLAYTAPSTSGNVLTSNGSAWVSSAPTAATNPATPFAFTDKGTNYTAVAGDVLRTTASITITFPTLTAGQYLVVARDHTGSDDTMGRASQTFDGVASNFTIDVNKVIVLFYCTGTGAIVTRLIGNLPT